ncbi:hypothetical protein STRIP9103_08630 [Streptomyces ipomoeae 91-03]|uniref:Luciferase-like domain-containing protein n=1 Tax=Streptomyces ipomoeae 91-03 TaxID=698759 RepID=L1KU92_9ACTN|nr:hypothetical protein STRIP9103_08630 [Streptomyces ipomoeae 91-03]
MVFLDDDPTAAAARRDRLDTLAGEPYTSDARIFAGTPTQLADPLQELASTGLAGFRLRPAVLGHDLPAITRGLVPELQRGNAFRHVHEADTLRGLLGLPRPANRCTTTTTVWSDPKAGSHIEFSFFAYFARTAERAKSDFLFLADELRLREQGGKIYDLSSYDPDGPLPDIDPDAEHISRGRAQVRMYRDPLATARERREPAAANNWSIRDVIVETGNRQNFVGSPHHRRHHQRLRPVRRRRRLHPCPSHHPTGLDDFADRAVPPLQEQGVFRKDYKGPTLRDHLAAAAPW